MKRLMWSVLTVIVYVTPWVLGFFGLTLAQNLMSGCHWSFDPVVWTGVCADR